jgi:hypothetical protein
MSYADGLHEHKLEDALQGSQRIPLLNIHLRIFPSLPLDSVVWYRVYTCSESSLCQAQTHELNAERGTSKSDEAAEPEDSFN